MKSIYSAPPLRLTQLFLVTLFLNGCSVLVGQVKPIDEKAPRVPFTEVNVISSNWTRIDIHAKSKAGEDIPDAAWQSTPTAAVISLNSACRQITDDGVDLKEVTQILLSQWDDLKIVKETSTQVSGFPALQTEAEGKYLGRERKFETVVAKTPTCVYDLVYLSPVKSFDEELSIFERFRDSLNLK